MDIKQFLHKIYSVPNNLYNFATFRYRHVKHGNNLKINGRIFCVSNSPGGIVIGDNVRINSSRSSNPIGGDTRTIFFAKGDGKIRIGNNCGISNATFSAIDSITICDYVLIGGNVKIYDSDFHSLNFKGRISGQQGLHCPIVIKDGAFIGAHSVILKGVTIGEKSIVGAGSVVTNDIPDGEIWAGNPAKFIKKIEEDSYE